MQGSRPSRVKNRLVKTYRHTVRLNYSLISPKGRDAFLNLEKYLESSTLERPLLELVRIRASQLNGCAFCLSYHVPEALARGESNLRIHLLPAWRESKMFTPREEAALAWTEAVTNVQDGHVPDPVFAEARSQFSERELVDLTWVIVSINGWNRMAISFRRLPKLPAPAVDVGEAPLQERGRAGLID